MPRRRKADEESDLGRLSLPRLMALYGQRLERLQRLREAYRGELETIRRYLEELRQRGVSLTPPALAHEEPVAPPPPPPPAPPSAPLGVDDIRREAGLAGGEAEGPPVLDGVEVMARLQRSLRSQAIVPGQPHEPGGRR